MSHMVSLSDEQARGVVLLKEWFKTGRKQIFKLAGYAGTGKSTLLQAAMAELGLKHEEVAYLAYTGRASLVLVKKGLPAQTIHRFVYEPLLSSYKDALTQVSKVKIVGFMLRPEVADIRLIVVDEVSMVGEKLLADLCSFGIKVLALGDPGQLPPVLAKPNHLLDRPDVFLQTIHRQAADNPILWAASRARQGLPIPLGEYGALRVIRERDLGIQEVLSADQVIACTHKNRKQYNRLVRETLGYDDSPLPLYGEKLTVLSNRWDDISSASMTPLINGLDVRVTQSPYFVNVGKRSFYMSMDLDGAEGDTYYDLKCNLAYYQPLRGEEINTEANMAHTDFGYAKTVHKMQGSECDTGVFIYDLWGSDTNRAQLAYTGITRFAKRCTIVLP